MGTRIVHLIRHGRYFSDRDHPCYGHLTEFGEIQARYAAEVCAELNVHQLRASTMVRARETADLIHDQIGIDVPRSSTHALRELMPAATAEHVSSTPILRDLSSAEQVALLNLSPRLRDALDRTFADSSGYEVDRQRARKAGSLLFKTWKRPGQVEDVVVSHGNLIRFLVCAVLGAAPEQWYKLSIYHCSITRFIVQDSGEVSLDCFNDTQHLPPDYRTQV